VRHEILGGLVQLYRRDRSRFWQCSASYKGRQFRASTKEHDLPQAQQFAEDWYLEIRGKARAGILPLKKERPSPRRPISSARNTMSSPKANAVQNGSKATASG
jgi:hypothetical protein